MPSWITASMDMDISEQTQPEEPFDPFQFEYEYPTVTVQASYDDPYVFIAFVWHYRLSSHDVFLFC